MELRNFRSHVHSKVRFPAGRTLLEGDIGSGKSSVLMAIEFALFGLGADPGNSVLRLGADEAEVRMTFDVDGLEYEVKRRLQRKGGRVQQVDGELKTPTETLNLSPSELKEKVLEVLEFNEAPDPKAQSWIYRYAVYTPQEEMKSILALAPDQRLQILRRAFRLEDYKTATNNAEEAARALRMDAARLEGMSEGLDELRAQTELLMQEEEKHQREMSGFEADEMKGEEETQKLRAEFAEIQKRELALQGTKNEREYYERLETDASKDASDLAVELEELRGRLEKAEAVIEGAGGKKTPTTIPVTELKRRERSLEGRVKKLTGLKAATEAKLAEYLSITEEGKCPVCERPVEAHDFDDKRSRKAAERDHVERELTGAEAELEELRGKIEEAEEFQDWKKAVTVSRSEASRLKEEISRKEGNLNKLKKRATFAGESMKQLGEQLQGLEVLAQQKKDMEKEIGRAEGSLRRARDNLIKSRERVEGVQKRQTEIAIQIVAKDDASNKGRRLREREIWLTDFFVPTVREIEKSVLATINQEFDALFRRWFAMLVADPEKEVSVDEDFTPFVTQGGYEQDVRYLSGGERTSVALAYRLALNLLAQKASVGMKSNLLVLDEPTDGFSKEQLGSVREVLDEVGCPQVIIVSHDKELESFADQIFKVVKIGDESSTEPPREA